MKSSQPSPGRPGPDRKILFLCTGNYYRSRMAEEIFNHLAQQASLDFIAVSKGLADNVLSVGNVGPIAPLAVSTLESSGCPVRSKQRWPESVSEQDLASAETIVALNRPEHQPMLLSRFPQYAARVIYWNVPDIGEMPVQEAFTLLQSQIQEMIPLLSNHASPGAMQ